MGSCYSITFTFKFGDKKRAAEKLRGFIDRKTNPNAPFSERANFNETTFIENGVDTQTLDGMLRMIFAGYPRTPFKVSTFTNSQPAFSKLAAENWATLTNDFDASYGWESVMIDAFYELDDELFDGSSLIIDCDDGRDVLEIQNGEAVQIE